MAVIVLLVGAAALHVAVFMPLHLAHTYYLYAIGGLLVVAVGLVGVGLRESGDWRRHLAWALVALFAVFGVRTYVNGLLQDQLWDGYRKPVWFIRLAREIAARTTPRDVVFGMDWNPELPFYARRRALMWPGWGDRSPEGSDVAGSIRSLAGYPIGAVVSCSRTMPEATLARFRDLAGLSAEDRWAMSAPTYEDHGHGECVAYFRGPRRSGFQPIEVGEAR
jgi:hypothetical protein